MKTRTYQILCIGFVSFLSSLSYGDSLERSWSRSTLTEKHIKFRHLNRMSPLLHGDLVIQGNAVNGIQAFDRKTGQSQWSRTFKNGVEGGAALSDGKLFFGANNGQFYCLDASTGVTVWEVAVESESLTAPVVQGSFVFHLTGNNTLNAFDKDTGRSLWVKTRPLKALMTVRGQTQPLFHNGVVYAGFSDGVFAAYSAENGLELWTRRIGDDKKFNDVDASARVYNDCILVASYANALFCLNIATGAIKWQHDQGGFLPVTVVDDKIYYPTADKEIHILDGPSGKLLKKIVLKKGLATSVVPFKNFVMYGETKGSLVLRDKETLMVADTFSPGRGLFATPTVDGETGEIFIHSNEANLYKLNYLDSSKGRFPWAKH